MEVLLVVEGKGGWRKRLAEGRREQGLPLPSVEFMEAPSTTRVTRTMSRRMDAAALVRRVVEVKEVGRLVISFI